MRDLDLIDVQSAVPIEMESCLFTGAVQLDRAHLSSLDLTGCDFPSLAGWYLECDHDLSLMGVHCTGGVELAHARIGGQLSLTDAVLCNNNGPALNADGIQTGATIFADEDFRAWSNSPLGTLRLLTARIGGRLNLAGATVTNSAGPAVYADNAKIDGDTAIEGSRLHEHSDHATLSLIEALLQGDLNLSDATVTNDRGPALNADGAEIEGTAFLDDRFHAAGHGARGVVRLPGARISGQLSSDGAKFVNYGSQLSLDLSGVHVDDELIVSVEDLINDRSFRVECDGLEYAAVPRRARRPSSSFLRRSPSELWIALLRDRTLSYAAQPYQQLAARYRSEGHERDARRILIAQQLDLRARGQIGGNLAKAWHRISGLSISYGYRPARALLGLLATLALSLGLVFFADAANTTARTKDQPPGACASVEHVGLAIDLAIPLLKAAGQQRCDIVVMNNASPWFVAGGWVIRCLGWAFATLFVAGFTGVVRR